MDWCFSEDKKTTRCFKRAILKVVQFMKSTKKRLSVKPSAGYSRLKIVDEWCWSLMTKLHKVWNELLSRYVRRNLSSFGCRTLSARLASSFQVVRFRWWLCYVGWFRNQTQNRRSFCSEWLKKLKVFNLHPFVFLRCLLLDLPNQQEPAGSKPPSSPRIKQEIDDLAEEAAKHAAWRVGGFFLGFSMAFQRV